MIPASISNRWDINGPGLQKKEEELQDLRDIRKSVFEYTDNVTGFYDEATEFLNKWRNEPLFTTDPYNPPNATFGEASKIASNVTFGNASIGPDNVAFGNASTSTKSLEEETKRIELLRKRARANVNGKQV